MFVNLSATDSIVSREESLLVGWASS